MSRRPGAKISGAAISNAEARDVLRPREGEPDLPDRAGQPDPARHRPAEHLARQHAHRRRGLRRPVRWRAGAVRRRSSPTRPSAARRAPRPRRNFAYQTSATQVLFLQHIIDALKTGGRCGMVIDEGVLFRTNEDAFVKTKRKLTDECDLWCILSLPGGVFSAPRRRREDQSAVLHQGQADREDLVLRPVRREGREEDTAHAEALRGLRRQARHARRLRRSWTVDLAARTGEGRSRRAARSARPRASKAREADRIKDRLAELKKAKPRDEAAIADAEATIARSSEGGARGDQQGRRYRERRLRSEGGEPPPQVGDRSADAG